MAETRPAPTPSLASVIQAMIEKRLADVHTLLPGEIMSVNTVKGTANVKPLLKRKYVFKDEATDLPVIPEVPIIHPRFGKARIKFPVAKGDNCMLLFVERSIDDWYLSGGSVDPKDPRKFALSDAVCLPGLYPLTKPLLSTSRPSSLELRNNRAVIEMMTSGKFRIGNDVVELLSLIGDLVALLKTAQIPTMLGLQGFVPPVLLQLTLIETKLKTITG